MKVLLDACVLYPTALRQILICVAGKGLFTPLWSDRILEEWARATRKLGPLGEPQARAEIALLRADWPSAAVSPRQADMARLYLPDPNDVHVLAAAIAGSADLILTFNAQDFPRGSMRDEGLERAAPDAFLYDLWCDQPDAVRDCVQQVHQEFAQMQLRPFLKKARLPRLGKALSAL